MAASAYVYTVNVDIYSGSAALRVHVYTVNVENPQQFS
jgi:hypothetical protein